MKKSKLRPKIVDCVFLGYTQRSTTYRFLVVKFDVPDMHVDTITESRDATFFENMFPKKGIHRISRFLTELTPEPTAPVEFSEQPVENEEILKKNESEAPRRSKRQRVVKLFGDNFTMYLVDDIPTSIAEAYASPDADDWKEVVHNEMDSILSNGT
jgi:hypothetical protein